MRIATPWSAGSVWMQQLDKAAADIQIKTVGRVTIKYFAGGLQSDEADFVRKIKLGQLDGADLTANGLALIDESIRVLELPMLFDSPEELDYVADKMWPYFKEKFATKGFSLGERGEVGPVHWLTKNKVESIADLKAQKLWQRNDDSILAAYFRKLGLTTSPLGIPEVDSALTSGRITACYGSPVAAVEYKWDTKIKFLSSMPLGYSISATVISSDIVKKLSAEDRKAVEDISRASAKKLRKAARTANADAQSAMRRKGVSVVTTPAAMVDAFTKAASDIQLPLTGKVFSKEELDTVLKYRSEYRAKPK